MIRPLVSPNKPIRTTTHPLSNSIVGIETSIPTCQQTPYRSHCSCVCHSPRRFTSAHWLLKAVGTLFVGYSGHPTSILQLYPELNCQCKRASTFSVTYIFPFWFFTMVVATSLTFAFSGEIQTSLKIRRQIAPGAEVFRLTYQDDVNGLKQLFNKGLASPNDISYIDGTTPLGVSTFFLLVQLS